MKKTLLFILIALFIFGCKKSDDEAAPDISGAKNLTIFCVNDQHGQINNFSKIKYIVDAEKQHTRVIVACGGDIFSGNPVVDFYDEKGYPMIDAIERNAGFSSRDTDQDKLRKLETWMEIGGFILDESLPLYASLLSIPTGDEYPPLDLDPKQQRELLLNAHAGRFSHLPSERPVLYLVEDAHWIDPTSLELLELQVERVQDISTLLVITYRPEFEAPWVGRAHVTTLTLNRLNRRNVHIHTEPKVELS